MKLNEMKSTDNSRKSPYRAARGMAQGRGKQAGKGQSGQNKRNGTRPGFEGGQNPWYRRLPKIGFSNFNATEYQVINLETINEKFDDGALVDYAALKKAKLVSRQLPIKLLGQGVIAKKLTIRVQAASKSAVAAVEKAGGKVELS